MSVEVSVDEVSGVQQRTLDVAHVSARSCLGIMLEGECDGGVGVGARNSEQIATTDEEVSVKFGHLRSKYKNDGEA